MPFCQQHSKINATEGPILLQKHCNIGEDETMGDLYTKKLFPMGVDAMIKIVDVVKTKKTHKA